MFITYSRGSRGSSWRGCGSKTDVHIFHIFIQRIIKLCVTDNTHHSCYRNYPVTMLKGKFRQISTWTWISTLYCSNYPWLVSTPRRVFLCFFWLFVGSFLLSILFWDPGQLWGHEFVYIWYLNLLQKEFKSYATSTDVFGCAGRFISSAL